MMFLQKTFLFRPKSLLEGLTRLTARNFARNKKGQIARPAEHLKKIRKELAEIDEFMIKPPAPPVPESLDTILRPDATPEVDALPDPAEISKKGRWSLTPHQYWLTHGKGSERPFTGDYWYHFELGHYECFVCSNTLFESQYKFNPPTGMSSFWHFNKGAVEVLGDADQVNPDLTNIHHLKYKDEGSMKQRCVCAKCKSHLGLVFLDGPPPTFLRYSINSGAMKFIAKQDFENPNVLRRKKKLLKQQRKVLELYPEVDESVVPIENFKVDLQKYNKILNEKRDNKGFSPEKAKKAEKTS